MLQKKQLTLAEVISDAPLSSLATYVRQITNDVTESTLDSTIAAFAPISDKSNIYFQGNSLDPMSLVVTDWRDMDMCAADFGFGRPVAFRQLSDRVIENLLEIYPRRQVEGDADHGLEIVVPFEKHAVDMLIEDPDMKRFCTFWGFEAGSI